MVKRLSDTSPEAERVLRETLRRMPFERRWAQMAELWRTARTLHALGYRDRHPDASRSEINEHWARGYLGDLLPAQAWRPGMAESFELPAAVLAVFGVLEELNIAYALGGSWASSLFG